MNFNEKLIDLRKTKGLSQMNFLEKLKISMTLSLYEVMLYGIGMGKVSLMHIFWVMIYCARNLVMQHLRMD